MNNSAVEQMLDDCSDELDQLQILAAAQGPATPYLTKYAIVRACGTIEQSFKTVVADHCANKSKAQVKRFLAVRVRDSSMNPSWENMCRLLRDFDEIWNADFKSVVNADSDCAQIKLSLSSLVEARNNFAHGGNPSSTIGDVRVYFDHAKRIIQYMDSIVS